MSTINFDTIDQSIRNIDMSGIAAMAETSGRAHRVIAIYRAINPVLAGVAAFPLLPPHWHDALKLFTAAFDTFAQGVPEPADPTFKAGKDI